MSSSEQNGAAPGDSQVGFGASGSELIAAWFDEIPAALWMVEGPEHRVVEMNRAARVSTGGQSAALGDSARKTASDFLDQARLARMDSVFASGHPMVEQDRSVTDRDAYGNPVELIVTCRSCPPVGVTDGSAGWWCSGWTSPRPRGRASTPSNMWPSWGHVWTPPGLRLSARYRFSAGQVTGGDWFDAVPLASHLMH